MQAGETTTLPEDGVESDTFEHVIVPHAAVAVIGRQMSTKPFAQTVEVTFGVVIRHRFTVTVPVAVHPGTAGEVTV